MRTDLVGCWQPPACWPAARRVDAADADVTSYGHWPAGRTPGTYAFDRLPSQQAQPEPQQTPRRRRAPGAHGGRLHRGAEGAAPDVLVQLGARVTRYDRSPWDDPLVVARRLWLRLPAMAAGTAGRGSGLPVLAMARYGYGYGYYDATTNARSR